MNFQEKIEAFARMTDEDFRQLEGNDLWVAAMVRMENADSPEQLTHGQLVLMVLTRYDAEVKNGGLCQFFVNSSRMFAPLLGLALEEVGAYEHRTHLEAFAAENNIDLTDLSSFISETEEEFLAQYQRYPFRDFDDTYYGMKDIGDYLMTYIEEHIEQF